MYDVPILSSKQIGNQLEQETEDLLGKWGVDVRPQTSFGTVHGETIRPDFWLPALSCRPAVAIECKNFGVQAKVVRSVQHRKVEEALLLLIKLRRYCPDALGARIILVSGLKCFSDVQIEFLTAELGDDFHVVTPESHSALVAVAFVAVVGATPQ